MLMRVLALSENPRPLCPHTSRSVTYTLTLSVSRFQLERLGNNLFSHT